MQPEKENNMSNIKTPKTYTIKMHGNGGEVVLGKVPNRIYDYFVENDIDLAEFSNDWQDAQIEDSDLHPFDPGAWFDCDGIAHESGVEMDEANVIEIFDQDGNIIWACNLDAANLEEIGCEVIIGTDIDASDQKEGSVVFYGQQFEKGVFFEGTIELTEPFDVTKLKFLCTEIEGWCVCSDIEYDNVVIDGEEGDIEEDGNYVAFIKILKDGDTQVYTGPNDEYSSVSCL